MSVMGSIRGDLQQWLSIHSCVASDTHYSGGAG
jgi:hypothetical protein